jgi:crossover junction endodeoxyribonuclease RusA
MSIHNQDSGGELRVTLPFPPSTNSLFRNVRGRGRVRSEAYKAWAIEAGYRVNRAARLKGPVSVSVALCAPDKRRRDADNSLKPILDLLVKHGVIEADDWSIVRSVKAEWVDEGDPCLVTIRSAA